MKNKIFELSHLVLYAKGWYQKSDNIWADLIKILEIDNYSPFNKNDVYSIIVNSFEKFDHRTSELREVLNGIHESNCWKFGYYTKYYGDKKYQNEYDMPIAFVYYVLSCLRFIENNQWNVQTPKYNIFPKNKDISTKNVIEMFNKK